MSLVNGRVVALTSALIIAGCGSTTSTDQASTASNSEQGTFRLASHYKRSAAGVERISMVCEKQRPFSSKLNNKLKYNWPAGEHSLIVKAVIDSTGKGLNNLVTYTRIEGDFKPGHRYQLKHVVNDMKIAIWAEDEATGEKSKVGLGKLKGGFNYHNDLVKDMCEKSTV